MRHQLNTGAEPPRVVSARNRLAREKSPYLLQHADNPVDWYPWGDEAFDRARKEDKPVFLSIGYSTCHWCHVMERESFEDPKVAALLNRVFVPVKVDREERPDIDMIYMEVCQLMTGSGGWPLTIVMTPEMQPFFAATYIPRESRFGRKGMIEIVGEIEALWRSQRNRLIASAGRITRVLVDSATPPADERLDEGALHLGFDRLAAAFDPVHGGFGRQMKFPTPHQLIFLLRYYHRTRNPSAVEMVRKTLTHMRLGGIWDHLGYGFHRYATEPTWRVPHFEKMLYDQALLMLAYTEAFEVTGEPLFERTVSEIAEYVLRDMTSPAGAFFSAEDADSEGEEGRFYVWTEDEIRGLLNDAYADLFIDAYGVSSVGNFTDESLRGGESRNILHQRGTVTELAARTGLSEPELTERLAAARRDLFHARTERVRPFRDEKILTAWNGLMIGALARASWVFRQPVYVEAAERAMSFVLGRLAGADGRLWHRYSDGEVRVAGTLDDYAFVAFGLLELYQATFNAKHLKEAVRLTQLMIELFEDPAGGFFFVAKDGEKLLKRPKELYDGAVPSGNSMAIYNLLRLGRLTGRSDFEQRAAAALSIFGEAVHSGPIGHAMCLVTLGVALGPSVSIVVAGQERSGDSLDMIDALRRVYAPNTTILFCPQDASGEIGEIAPFVKTQRMIRGRATAYVCDNLACSSPTNDPQKMLALVEAKRG